MDLQLTSPHGEAGKCCDCGCICSSFCSTETWLRSVKRKYGELEGSRILSVSGLGQDLVVRVEAENEILALREMVGNQQQAIQDLISDLEEERNASSSSANEAMSMILRLQREKAECQMEARQFKCMAEERIGHDQLEISAMEDLLYKREQVIQGLMFEVHAYKRMMMNYGLTEAEADGENSCERSNDGIFGTEYELPSYEYSPLKCTTNDNPGPAQEEHESLVIDISKYPFGETPRDRLKNLDNRIHQMERTSSFGQLNCGSPTLQNITEKIIVGHSPQRPNHCRRLSGDSLGSFAGLGRDPSYDFPTESPRVSNSLKNYVSHTEMPSTLKTAQNAPEEENDVCDRIYTVETVYDGVQSSRGVFGTNEDYITTPRKSFAQTDIVDPDIKKLYARLQALEADRESMCHAIISMQTDKAQLVLLKEIAQRLCKDPPAERRLPPKKPAPSKIFSVLSIFKWMGSILWRRRARQCKYNLGLSPQHVGLLMLLQNITPPKELRRCLTKVQARV